MAEFQVHRRQFVIARSAFNADRWPNIDLGGDFVLSHHPDLHVEPLEARPGFRLGSAVLDGAGGRFVTISGGILSVDAAGLLGVYYLHGSDGPIITSSPALAATLGDSERHQRALRWGGLNWFSPPAAPCAGVFRLLCDQSLQIETLEIQATDQVITPYPDNQLACTALADYLVGFVKALPEGRRVLSLTAGLDSRLLLAALVASGEPFETFTQDVKNGATDTEIAARLSRHFGVKHHVVTAGQAPVATLDEWRLHTLRSTSDADDNMLIPDDQYRGLGRDDLLIRGGCFELGRGYYDRRFILLDYRNASPEKIWRRFETAREIPADFEDGIADWLAWRRARTMGLSLAESFYLDQRIGGWLASIEQGLDGFAFRSVQPGNSRTVFNALCTPQSRRDRRAAKIQKDTCELLCPGILQTPVNPTPWTATFLRRAVKAKDLIASRMRHR